MNIIKLKIDEIAEIHLIIFLVCLLNIETKEHGIMENANIVPNLSYLSVWLPLTASTLPLIVTLYSFFTSSKTALYPFFIPSCQLSFLKYGTI